VGEQAGRASAAGQASVQVSAGQVSAVGQVSAQVSGEALAPVLVPRLAVVPNSNMAIGNALAPDQGTTWRRCRHCTKRSHRSPSPNCSCQRLQGLGQASSGQVWGSAQTLEELGVWARERS